MKRIKSSDTSPEKALRAILWSWALRYRKHYHITGVRVDIGFVRPRVVVLIDGCFWHGCPDHYGRPKTRQEYWDRKLRINQERDRRNNDLTRCNPVQTETQDLDEKGVGGSASADSAPVVVNDD